MCHSHLSSFSRLYWWLQMSLWIFLENQYETVLFSSLGISLTFVERHASLNKTFWSHVTSSQCIFWSDKADSLHLLIIWSVYVTKITKAGAAANAWAAPHEAQENICHLLKPQSAEWKRLLAVEGVELHLLALLGELESESAATFDKTDVLRSLAWSFFCCWTCIPGLFFGVLKWKV